MNDAVGAPRSRRYEPLHRLGKGGGGDVWAVRDTLTGHRLAMKLLAPEASRAELLALVREASALVGLEGLGLPRIVRFGVWAETGQTYFLRELLPGRSLADALDDRSIGLDAALGALADAAQQLAQVHRAGFLHGDLKPGNIIVDAAGHGSLVDLGLSTPYLEGGSRAQGLTPGYAAPELLRGGALTVRTEVFSLGASLAEIVERLDDHPARDRRALDEVVARASHPNPAARYPSVDELARALRQAAKLPAAESETLAMPWPIVGFDAIATTVLERALALPAGGHLRLVGPAGSGRTTLLRRLGWSLGASGHETAWVTGETTSEHAMTLELGNASDQLTPEPNTGFVLIDDADRLTPSQRAEVLARCGARRRIEVVSQTGDLQPDDVALPRLAPEDAGKLLRVVLPSLGDNVVLRLLQVSDRRPGALQSLVMRLASSTVVSADEVEALLAQWRPEPGAASLEHLLRAVDRGRFGEALALAAQLERADDPATASTVFLLAKAKVSIATGAFDRAQDLLERATRNDLHGHDAASIHLLEARLALRRGQSAEARALAERVAATTHGDLAADAEAVLGVACVLLGEPGLGAEALARALKHAVSDRARALAWGSLGFVEERAGRETAAARAYEHSLALAEEAGDAWTLATTRANLAGLLRKLGDAAGASRHLEAAIDMGLRAGGSLLVELARLNLLSLDLYLGRYARAEELVLALCASGRLAAGSHAQLLGLEAELSARTGKASRALELYDRSRDAYLAMGRAADAAEVGLERLLLAVQLDGADARELLQRHARLLGEQRPAWFDEHEALALFTEACLRLAADDNVGRQRLDQAIELAEHAKQPDLVWRARARRGAWLAGRGARARARQDIDAALSVLEGMATELPRDLREVFWNDPRRAALRARGEAAQERLDETDALQAPTRLLRDDAPSRHFEAGLRDEQRLLRVLEITRELARERDLGRLLERVVEHAIALARADRGAILLRASDDSLEIHTSKLARGVEDELRDFSRSVASAAMQDGVPVVTTNAESDPRFGDARSVHALALKSIVCVPIHGAPPANQAIGALYLENRSRPEQRFEAELPTLAAFADQAAIAIENARLFAEVADRALAEARQSEELARAKQRLEEVLSRRTEQLQSARKDLRRVRADIEGRFGYHGLVGTSPAMRKLYDFIERVKDTDIPVLILGESGTGKEVVARAIHQAGARAKSPFVGINCGAIPANLLESELFGHVRGAFTGADRERAGLLRDAAEGTILLDEIGEMPLAMQAGLLRVLQDKRVRPLGGSEERPVHARMVAATNRDLDEMVQQKLFREDLFYRLHVATVRIPPLRERREDIPALVDHFLSLFAARYRRERKPLSRAALRALTQHAWPGNVRQLEHVLLSAWLMGDGDDIEESDLTLPQERPSSREVGRVSRPRAVSEVDKESIERALREAGGNRLRAAEALGMPRRTFYRRLKDYDLL